MERGAERQLTLVPSPRPDLEAFTEAASKEHQLEFGPDLVAEMLPPDEDLDKWELVAIEGGEHFWFVDPTVAPRFRVVVLSFNYNHQYLDGEFVDAADLVLDALAKLRDVRPPPPNLVQPPHAPAPRAPSLEAPAQALVRALPLFGPAVSAEVARKVAGVSTSQFRFAVVQLMGHGWVAMPTLYVWDDRFSTGRELETLVVYGHPGEQPEAGMQARWNELAGEPEIELARRARREARWLDVKK